MGRCPLRSILMRTDLRFCHFLMAGLFAVLLASRVAAQAPMITRDPVSQTNKIGSVVQFSAEVSGTQPLSYYWYFEGFLLSSYTSPTLSFTVASIGDAGTYWMVASNALGSATSAPVHLTVLGPPYFIEPPLSRSVYQGQSTTFSPTAYSPVPTTYQWLFGAKTIPGATNVTLELSNVTTNQAGYYSLQAKNEYGTTTSTAALLTVKPLPIPSLTLGTLQSDSQVRIPVILTAHGTETHVGFSVGFNASVFTNASFEADSSILLDGTSGIQIQTDTTQLGAGRIGVSAQWIGSQPQPGDITLGLLVFDFAAGKTNAIEGQLGFLQEPTPAVFLPALDGTTNLVLNVMNPQWVHIGGFSLNRQTGFQQQQVRFGNPGNTFVENARLTVSGLIRDSLTNLIVLANAQGVLIPQLIPYVDLGAIAPGEVREAVLEYYVTDRVTTPSPTLGLLATPSITPPNPKGSLVATMDTRWTNNLVLVEFPTQKGLRYYIQYASSMEGFTNGNFSTSLPPMIGSGSRRQWLDSGPSRTRSNPVFESRFYRVLESR